MTVVPHGASATVEAGGIRLGGDAPRGHGGDELLCSAAQALGSRVIAVVLTGRLSDESEGVRAVKRRGGRVLAQDPTTARAPQMPSNAIATGCVDFVLPPQRMGAALVALTMAPGGSDLLAVATPSWASLGR